MEEVVGKGQDKKKYIGKNRKAKTREVKRKLDRGKIPDILKQEMENINKNLTEMQTKFEQKIQGIEKIQKQVKSKKTQKMKKTQKKRSIRKLSLLNQKYHHPINQKMIFQSNFKTNEQSSILPNALYTPCTNLPFNYQNQDELKKNLLQEMSDIIDKRLKTENYITKDKAQNKIQKVTTTLERLENQ